MWLGLYFSQETDISIKTDLKEVITGMAYAYSDQLHWASSSTLVIEIQKSQRLYLTLEKLADELVGHLSNLQLKCHSSIAPNPMAAALLAKHQIRCWSQESLEERLDHWPIHQLTLNPNVHRAIEACGIKTLKAFKKQPSNQRMRRFGAKINHYIDSLYGCHQKPLQWSIPAEDYYQRIDLHHPITNAEILQHHLFRSLNHLAHWLYVRDKVLNQLTIRLKHEAINSSKKPDLLIHIGLAEPGFNRCHLEELIKLKLENIRIEQPLNTIIVQCKSHLEHSPEHKDLFNQHHQGQSWHELLDRLKTKLGQEALRSLAMRPDHQPEHSWCWTQPNETQEVIESRLRPTWLISEPIPCNRQQLTLEQGPERIETGWWTSDACQRDYWVAKEPYGRRLWVFHEHHPRMGWFIHGIFD